MYKRPSPFKHGCHYSSTPLSQYDLARLLPVPTPNVEKKKKPYTSPTAIMYPKQYEWLNSRSELTCEKREELLHQYQKDGNTEKYLKGIHMLPPREPDMTMTANEAPPKIEERPIFWGYATLVLKIEGDHVKVHVDGKLGDIHVNYFQKAKKPPLRPYAEALLSAGRSATQVNNVIDGYVWWKKNKDEMQSQFERLFPPEKKKSTVTTKKVLKAVVKRIV